MRLGGSSKRIRAKYTTGHQATEEGSFDSPDCFCVRFSPDDKYLAASFADGSIHVYNADSGAAEFKLNEGHGREGLQCPLPTTQLRWRPHSQQSKTKSVLVSVNAEFDGQILHWHIKSGKCLHTITERGNQIFCLDFFQDGSQFATAGRDRLVRVYDEATKRLVQTLQGGDLKNTAGHSNRVFSLKYHPQAPHLLLSGGWDNTVQVWDLRRGHSVRSLWNCYICGDSVDFTHTGEQVLTGSWRTENALQVWDFGSGQCLENVDWQGEQADSTCMIYCAQFSKDPGSGMIAAGGSQENEAKFFCRGTDGQLQAFGALMNLPKPVFTLDFSNSSRLAAVGASDGQVRVLECR